MKTKNQGALVVLDKKGKKEKMKKYYTIYKINKENNDIENVAEFEEREKASKWIGVSLKHLSDYVTKSIDNLTCKLREDKYFIMVELDN